MEGGCASLTCPSCRISVVPSRARSMCPFCGSFYNRAADGDVSLRRRSNDRQPVRLPQLVDSNMDNASRSQPEFFVRGSVRSSSDDHSGRQIVQVTGFGPLITDTLGVIHTYITGLLLPPTSPSSSSPMYLSLPPISAGGEGQLVTLREGATRQGTYATPCSGRSTVQNKSALLDDLEPELIMYPTKDTTIRQLKEDLEEAKLSGDYSRLQEFYESTFGSLLDICATFKIDPDSEGAKAEDPELKMEFLYEAYDSLEDVPSYITKAALKATVGAVLATNVRLKPKDETKALFALLYNPLFSNQSSYTVFAHLFRRTIGLSSGDHQLLINWFTRSEPERLRALVKRILQFVTIREFPPANGHKLPSISKSRWWIPNATRTLALINTANCRFNLIPYTEFYNSALDHINLMAEYYRWQNPPAQHKSHNAASRFSYCQYPFILSIVAKKMILQRDSEQQMILNARRSLMSRALHQQAPDIDVFFLNLNVRRGHLVSDSLNEIARKQSDLKKKLKVTFVGEPGLDMGGLTKEWFLLLIKHIFDPDYGMFVYHNKSRCYWFSTTQAGNLREYNLIGVVSFSELCLYRMEVFLSLAR
ncbi:hypothetical protein JTE90_016084, partial [Oedothorax gibbosus]